MDRTKQMRYKSAKRIAATGCLLHQFYGSALYLWALKIHETSVHSMRDVGQSVASGCARWPIGTRRNISAVQNPKVRTGRPSIWKRMPA